MDHTLTVFLKKWTTLEISILGFCILLKHTADAHILVYSNNTNQPIEEYNDLPAQFGPSLPTNGLKVFPILAHPDKLACTPIDPPPRRPYPYPPTSKFVAIVERGGENCSFEKKVRIAQAAGFNAVIIYNNEGDELEQMSAKNSSGINIPSVFVGHTTGMNLIPNPPYQFILVINDELPFNINTQLILPFAILIGLCFLIMIFYMVYKCIREERRLRRYRLPKSMLKKLPITKFTKTNDLSYDTCVICLEEFVEGDKIRILPCKHPYHSHCIDPWLTENRRVCPICKRKVFTKGEVRTNRNRQASLDSVTDTDDDTTPLLRPPTGGGGSHADVRTTATTTATNAATASNNERTTHHGTFERRVGVTHANATSDDENVLLAPSDTRRFNPFNQPQRDANNETRQTLSGAFFSFARLFRRQRSPISIIAPHYLEEYAQQVVHVPVARGGVPTEATAAAAAAALTSAAAMSSSNNILNPNLSGSFKGDAATGDDSDNDDDDDDDDDYDDYESPPHSIYEPTAVITHPRTTAQDVVNDDSVFIQTPTQGGIGVAALPNPTNRPPPTTTTTNQQGQFLI